MRPLIRPRPLRFRKFYMNIVYCFDSNYFELEEDELDNYNIFICSYNYNSATGYVDSGTFNIKQINETSSDVVYQNNNIFIEVILPFIIVICCIALSFCLWHLFNKIKN